jgi:hypothetical protein
MRFFSNDARESTDEQPNDDRPDRVQSDPVAVPNQRPPSPWSNTPSETGDTARDDTAATGTADEADRPPFHEPNAQPTALGAATVGGAVAASATAGPSSGSTYASSTASKRADTPDGVDAHDHGGGTDPVDLPLDDTDKSSSAPASGPTDSSSSPADSSTGRADSDTASTDSDELKDDGGFDDPKAVDPATDKPLETASSSSAISSADSSPSADDDRPVAAAAEDTTTPEAGTLKDDGGFDDPKAVDPATDAPLVTDGTSPVADSKDGAGKEPATDSTPPAVVPVPVGAAAPAAKPDTLFEADDAQSFHDRWREVQLRFVDSPKDAAGDAAKLVDEAVEKLTASLKSQRDGLANDTDDTEQLRVQLRGYREILTRIIGL